MAFWNKRSKLSESERSAILASLMGTGCLFIFMVSRRINDSQVYLLLDTLQRITGNDNFESLAHTLIDQLAYINQMDPWDIVASFQRGQDLHKQDKHGVLLTCVTCALLDQDQTLVGLTGDYAREMGVSREVLIKRIAPEAMENLDIYKIMAHSREHQQFHALFEEALSRTTPPPEP